MLNRFGLAAIVTLIATTVNAQTLFPNYPQVGGAAYCDSTQNTSTCVNTVPAGPTVLTGNETLGADTNLSNGQNPQSVKVPAALLMPGFENPRNMLDNGAMAVIQRGTGIQTCAAAAAITSAAYSADRWGCSANVTSGAGRSQVTTTVPAPPAGFQNSNRLYRTSGALLQPVCSWQEIPTVVSTQASGKTVTLSFYAQALAGLSADNNNLINGVIISGTGTDEGFGTMTASPAITPAWTGIATVITTPFTITTGWVRYSTTVTLASTVTELGVGMCFTPTATGAGTTDGFAFTGVQLEVAPSPTQYEYRPYPSEFQAALRYFYKITESATAATTRGSCTNLTSSISNCVVPFPVVMAKVPTMTYATGFGIAVAAQTSYTACTANATSTTATSVASTLAVLMSCATSAAGGALGTSTTWGDAGGTGTISASADF